MTTALASKATSSAFSGAQLNLIRGTVAKDCSPLEFDLFITIAQRAGLDPLRRQISAIVFDKSDPDRRRMSVITNIDGLRAIAARTGRYRPDEGEPQFELDPDQKAPANPAGLVKAALRIYVADPRPDGGWKPVAGVAYWDEFAPVIETSAGGYDWVETGERWPDTGRPKMRKVARAGEIQRRLEPSSPWARMPRVMLAKCAEAQALRRAFPECLSALYEAAELDQAQANPLTPSQQAGAFETGERLGRIGAANGVLFQLAPDRPLDCIPLGQVADRVIETIRGYDCLERLDWFEGANRQPLREFWARAPGDALELKRCLEQRRSELSAARE
jgi:phage recombination protein Bet